MAQEPKGKSKYSAMIAAELRQSAETTPAHEEQSPAAFLPSKFKRPGKRSDPAFSPTTFFVRKDTKRKAVRLLEDEDTGKDLSDLVEQLLSQWVSDHSHA